VWRASGGEVIDTLYLGDLNDYRLTLERTMLLDSSRERSEALGRLLELELQIEPRRRGDVDLIVMVAEPAAARSIRALLPFLYAGDIPVEGISLSNGGGANRENDLDLENLRLIDMPWFSDAERALRGTTVIQQGPAERLMALGVDACRLQSRVGLLARAQAGGLGGATGELSVDTQRRLHRKGTWYVFNAGQVRSELPRTDSPQPSSTDGETTWKTEGVTAPQRSDALPKTAR
jgi:outer membrane PBP1 activator LpoA protein